MLVGIIVRKFTTPICSQVAKLTSHELHGELIVFQIERFVHRYPAFKLLQAAFPDNIGGLVQSMKLDVFVLLVDTRT